ncbi:hypothetical protein S140_51 [Shewanella sp. phage 1/40]|uniref:hypothetical protein n=1 Tax=Shewanella sp. phage 1/40 TaxID=1458860 RepID=UPI0004F83481|nr:hypothetical protein S140_51 [Shewanella sp. phage 1/40]AHK11461.1 hypothetical protein S140_51 [Shewanella sp. phage 1/40]
MLDLPPTYCELKQVAAMEIMSAVNLADLSKIKQANTDTKILWRALDNYMLDKPISVREFSIMIYERCGDE